MKISSLIILIALAISCAPHREPKVVAANSNSNVDSPAAHVRLDRATARSQFEANRAKWNALGINDYEIRLKDETCFCLYGPYYGPIRNIVRDGILKRAIYEGEERDGYWYGRIVVINSQLKSTVPDLFGKVEHLLNSAHDGTFYVQYDPEFGFPSVIDYDDPGYYDEQWRIVVDDFKPLRARHRRHNKDA